MQEEPSPAYYFSKTKTEREFFNLNPCPQNREFTPADRVYAQITDEIWTENAPKMERIVYSVFRDVSMIYGKKEKMSVQEMGQSLEALEEKIEEIRDIAPMNVAAVITKSLDLLDILDSKGVQSLNPDIRNFLENRFEKFSVFFKPTRDLDLPTRKEAPEDAQISTIAKVVLASLVLLGCALYGVATAKPITGSAAALDVFKNEPTVPQRTMLEVVQDMDLLKDLKRQNVDLSKRSSDHADATLLYLASQLNGTDSAVDYLYDSATWQPKDLFHSVRFLFKGNRYDQVERAVENGVLRANMMARNDLEVLWDETAHDPKARKILQKMGFNLAFLNAYSSAKILSTEFADRIVNDETLIRDLVSCKMDLMKETEDGNSLLAKYVMQAPSPNFKIFKLLKEGAKWSHKEILIAVSRMLSFHRFDLLQTAIDKRTIRPEEFSNAEMIQLWDCIDTDYPERKVPLLMQLGPKTAEKLMAGEEIFSDQADSSDQPTKADEKPLEEAEMLANQTCKLEDKPEESELIVAFKLNPGIQIFKLREQIKPLDWNSLYQAKATYSERRHPARPMNPEALQQKNGNGSET